MNAYEARLLGIERGLMGLGRQAGELQRDTWAGLQAARELWQEIPPSGPSVTPCANTKILFTVRQCASTGVGGSLVTVTGGGSTYTGTTASSTQVLIDVSATGARTYTWTTADPGGGRVAGTSGTVTTVCGTTQNVTTTQPPTAAYACTTICALPLKKTSLILTNNLGTATLTHNGTNWVGTQVITCATSRVACVLSGSTLICGGAAVAGGTLTITWSFGGTLTGTYRACPPTTASFPTRPLDDSVGANCGTHTLSPGVTSTACPPSFLLSMSLTDAATGLSGACSLAESP